MVRIKKQNGIALVELLIYLVLIAVVTPLISTVLIYGVDGYHKNMKYVRQQDSIVDSLQFLRKDIEDADVVEITDKASPGDSFGPTLKLTYRNITAAAPAAPDTYRYWRFDTSGSALTLSVLSDGSSPSNVISDIDSSQCKFEFSGSNLNKKLAVYIKPISSNSSKNISRNVKTTITEFSVRYKR